MTKSIYTNLFMNRFNWQMRYLHVYFLEFLTVTHMIHLCAYKSINLENKVQALR